jgi:hypothetical protein
MEVRCSERVERNNADGPFSAACLTCRQRSLQARENPSIDIDDLPGDEVEPLFRSGKHTPRSSLAVPPG